MMLSQASVPVLWRHAKGHALPDICNGVKAMINTLLLLLLQREGMIATHVSEMSEFPRCGARDERRWL